MALKKNSKAILDIIATQKGINQTQAYKQIHPNASDVTARNNASQLLKKPEAQIYLQKHVDRARDTIVSLLNSDKDDIKLRSATDILDRTQGKAIQQVQTNSTKLVLNIDLTSTDDITDTDIV